jgi:hypothetical protein
MLAMTRHHQSYIDACRARVRRQIEAYVEFWNSMALVLERPFVHRLRHAEGKDGNPANEVRLLASSILQNAGLLAADRQITLRPKSSVPVAEIERRYADSEALVS